MSPLAAERRTILLVEDNPGDAGLVESLLDDCGTWADRLVHVTTLGQALADDVVRKSDVVVLDLNLPDGFGLDCVSRLRARAPDVPIVVLTGVDDQELALECIAAGAQDYLAKDEMRASNLRRALNHAIARKREEAERRRADALQERHAAIVEASTDAIVSSTLDGIVTSWNRGAELIFGHTRTEALGRMARDLMRAPEGTSASARDLLGLRPPEQPGTAHEMVRMRKDGALVTLSVVSCNLRDALGNVVALAAICRDITEARQRELELQQRDLELEQRNRQLAGLLGDISTLARRLGLAEVGNASAPVLNARLDQTLTRETLAGVLAPFEAAFRGFVEANRELAERNRELLDAKALLEGANRELEAFGYSVAHDLRTPLAAVDGFADLLRHAASGRLEEHERHYIASITEATRRMAALIDDLLKLAQVTRAGLQRTHVDLSQLVRDVTAGLHEPGRKIEFVIVDGVGARADRQLIQIVLENLLRNAVKFTARSEHARIEFGAVRDATGQACFVRDNGVGFDPAFAHKLFGAFQRLHTQHEFTGTGVGLSIVRRVIERHGGRVWAEGRPDAGATFYFTLP